MALAEVHLAQAHASKLAPLIKEVVTIANIAMKDVSGIAVSAGPGSYTGLRIGTSTAKGLCFALAVPLYAVSTLDIMASQMSSSLSGDAWLCPMIDARRMEVYCALYNRQGVRLTDVEAKVIEQDSFLEQLQTKSVVFGGNGSDKCREVITHPSATFQSDVFPSARYLGALASKKVSENASEDLIRFEPFYLKEFKAKLPSKIIGPAVNKLG